MVQVVGADAEEKLMAETCIHCHLVHSPADQPMDGDMTTDLLYQQRACATAQATAMKYLLEKIGKQDQCKGCNAPIFWVRHSNGKAVPYTPAGLNHFVDCPERALFARP